MLSACGGGGSGDDISPDDPPVSKPTGSDKFLLFPNPNVLPDGSLQTNSQAYATAYYAAIDPANAKDTLAKWKAANGFDTGTGTQLTAVFGDKRDLGYGRRMTARKSPDGTIAFLVENYLANPGGYGFSPLNLEAAVVEDKLIEPLGNPRGIGIGGPHHCHDLSGIEEPRWWSQARGRRVAGPGPFLR